MSITFNTTKQALVDSNYKTIDWLFEITTAANVKYLWSTKADSDLTTLNASLSGVWASGISWAAGIDFWANTDVYAFKIVPETFSGVTLNRSRSEYGIIAPSEMSFSVGNASASLTAADFIDATLLIRLIVGNGTDDAIIRFFKFNIRRSEEVYNQIKFTCEDWLQKYLRGDYPNTKLVKELSISSDVNDDNICVPVPIGKAYIPLRSIYITNQRYYLLGEAGYDYNIHKVRSPRAWGNAKSEWDASSYTFGKTSKPLNSTNYFVFKAIIADSNGDGDADANGLWMQGDTFLDIPCQFDKSNTTNIHNPADAIKFVLLDMGVPSIDIGDSFITSKATYDSQGILFNYAYYYKRPKAEVLGELLNCCHSTLIVNDKIELQPLIKASQKTIDEAIVINPNTVGMGSFNYNLVTQTQSDSGYISFQQTNEAQDKFIKVLVPAKTSTDDISTSNLNIPFIQNSDVAQKIGILYYQRRLLQKANISFSGKYKLLGLNPDDAITISSAKYGGTYTALIDSISFTRASGISINCIQFKEALDDFADLSVTTLTVLDDTSSAQVYSPMISGPDSTTSTGNTQNTVKGVFRIGAGVNYIYFDPNEPIQKFVENGTTRLKIGDLGTNDYGLEILDSNAVSILRLDGSGVNKLCGFTANQYSLTASNGLVGLNSEVTGATDWRIWAGGATPSTAPFRIDESGNNYCESIYASGGTIGGFTLTSTMLSVDGVEIDSANQRIKSYTGSNYVQISPSGLIGYDSVLGVVFQIYTDGTAPYFEGSITVPTGEVLTIEDTATFLASIDLEIGVDIQAYDVFLTSIAGLGTAADKMVYTTAANTAAETDITPFARTLLDDANNIAARSTLGIGSISTQASDNVSITGGSISGLTTLQVLTQDVMHSAGTTGSNTTPVGTVEVDFGGSTIYVLVAATA